MNQAQQPEALQLAEMLEALGWRAVDKDLRKAAAELRRLHARVRELEGQQKRAPLTDERIESMIGAKVGHPLFAGAKCFIQQIERSHGITAQSEFQTDDERDHSDEDAAIAAGKVQAAVHGRTT